MFIFILYVCLFPKDAHKALELLEDYCSRLTSPNDKQLRIAIEKIIYIFKSSLFQALLGVASFFFFYKILNVHQPLIWKF